MLDDVVVGVLLSVCGITTHVLWCISSSHSLCACPIFQL